MGYKYRTTTTSISLCYFEVSNILVLNNPFNEIKFIFLESSLICKLLSSSIRWSRKYSRLYIQWRVNKIILWKFAVLLSGFSVLTLRWVTSKALCPDKIPDFMDEDWLGTLSQPFIKMYNTGTVPDESLMSTLLSCQKVHCFISRGVWNN